MKEKIKEMLERFKMSHLATFIIGWIILFDIVGGTCIPIVYGKGCGWFAIPNLLIDIYVVGLFVKRLKNEGLD